MHPATAHFSGHGPDVGTRPTELQTQRIDGLLALALKVTHASGIALAIEHDGEVFCCARAGRCAPVLGAVVNHTASLSGVCLQSGKPVYCRDTANDQRVDGDAARALGVGSLLAVPLKRNGQTIGLVEVFSEWPDAFETKEQMLLEWTAESVMKILDTSAFVRPQPAMVDPSRCKAASLWPQPGALGTRAARTRAVLLGLLAATTLGVLSVRTVTAGQSGAALESGSVARARSMDAEKGQRSVPTSYGAGNQDDLGATRSLEVSATSGDSKAEFELGRSYVLGRGVAPDLVNAYAWYSLAASKGNVAASRAQSLLNPILTSSQLGQAHANIAMRYFEGKGTPVDFVAAYAWSVLAQSSGNSEINDTLERLRAHMTAAELRKAKRLAAVLARNEATSRERGLE